jgi:diaminopimelate decarboxylase
MIAKLTVFPLTAEINRQGHLVIGGCDTTELAEKYGTPLYIFDEATIRQRCHDFKIEFARRYADTTVLYASKAFLNGALAVILKDEGMGLDVVSAGELGIADAVGFPMDTVYFHGNNKSAEELRLALKRHIGRIVVDNFDELKLLTSLAEETGHIPDILLRITPGVDAHTHGHLTTGAAGSKFGIPLYQAEEAISSAMAAASLNLVGLHFHIGSQIAEFHPYLDAMDLVLDLAAEMRQKYGFEMEELDIGGGFGVQYTLDSPMPGAGFFAEKIVPHLAARCQQLKIPAPTLTIEPGRSIVAQAGIALYRAGTIKEVAEAGLYVAVDGGMADNIRPALYEARYEALVANKAAEKETVQATIVGRYCETGDILIKNTNLAPVVAGDLVALAVCGAYCIPMSSNYNAALKPAMALVADGKARLIRRRETIQDLTRCDLL